MIYKLSNETSDYLSDLPETGMGYQVFFAKETVDSNLKPFIVYNAQLAIRFDKSFEKNKKLITKKSYKYFLDNSDTLRFKLDSIRLLNKKEMVEVLFISNRFLSISNNLEEGVIRYNSDKGAVNSNDKDIEGFEMFVRVSAFENDIRINRMNKSLKPNSYATTYFDYLICVNCNLDPIDRYALPNDLKIEWAFYIQPSTNDKYKEGVVIPNFGRKGGGKEVYFEKGTSDNSLIDIRQYGS
jgi:hypothetical protein